jgi:very-short-patch-repair endonuclease
MGVAAGMAVMAAMLRPRSPRCAVRRASTTAAGLCTPRHREGIGDSRRSQHGSPAARRLLQAADGGARSEAERLLIQLLKSAGITGWKANHPVGGYRVDVAFPGCKVAIEVDCLALHSDAEDFENDRVRQNAITLLGCQVLHFTWLDLTEYPDRVIAEIKRAICAR